MSVRTALLRTAFRGHYLQCRVFNRILPMITLDGVKLYVAPSVYKPLGDEHRIPEYMEPNKHVLDIGCGSGAIAIFAALISEHVTATDINPQAVENTLRNARDLGLNNLDAKVSDMFNEVSGETYDYIVCYPPLYKLPFTKPTERWATSETFVHDLFANAATHLKPRGKMLILLPDWFRPTPAELAPQCGLKVSKTHKYPKRSIWTRVHSIPYFHIDMKQTLYEVEKG